MYKESDTVTYIKINRLKWAGHVICMEEQSATGRVLVAVVEGRGQRGRPKLRWEDGVTEDGVTEDARKLREEYCKEYRQLAEAAEEGLGSKGAIVPMMLLMMMMMMLCNTPEQHGSHLLCSRNLKSCPEA